MDIREDFVRLGNCSNCKILNSGCSIGRPSNRSAGSVGFWVRSKHPSLIRKDGFLTAAHVAIERFTDLYDANVLLSNHPLKDATHEIVHPPFCESIDNKVIGHVVESFCGNFGDQCFGLDVAFINVHDQSFKGIIYFFLINLKYYPSVRRNDVNNIYEILILERTETEPANEEDLIFDGSLRVSKDGRTTGYTTGFLSDDSLMVCVDNCHNGSFYYFEGCFGVVSDQQSFFEPGDSGSGVYLLDASDTSKHSKPLGIAFARTGCLTAVCRIREFLDACNVAICIEEEPMDVDA